LTGISSALFRVPEPEHQRQTLAVGRTAMQIEKHDKSYIVKLEDGSSWRIWPGDIALTLGHR
jgi:hypothetical protein